MKIPAVSSVVDHFPGHSGSLRQPDEKDNSVSKVRGLALEKMGFPAHRAAHRGGLLPAFPSPQTRIECWIECLIANALPSAALAATLAQEKADLRPAMKERRKAKRVLRRPLAGEKPLPIGLESREDAPQEEKIWVNPFNALMQLLLFLPGFEELFSFAPRNLRPFQEFADQYRLDQEDNEAVSSASPLPLIQYALRKWPKKWCRSGFSFYELLQNVLKALLPFSPPDPGSNSLPEKHLVWHPKKEGSLREAIQRKANSRPMEMFVAIEGKAAIAAPKQVFAASFQEAYYELDAFVELRSAEPIPSFIAYLKTGEGWCQCDDERIAFFRSDALQAALGRAVLLHYRRIRLPRH
jgi:hypothetical protein